MKSISNIQQSTRRFSIACILFVPFFIAACSHKVSGTAFERNAIKLTKINLQIQQAKFNLTGEELAFGKTSGLEDGSYFRNMSLVATEALIANGISVSDKSDAEYTLIVRPGQYKVATQLPVGTKFRTVELTTTLLRTGQSQPLWTGSSQVSVRSAKSQSQTTSELKTDLTCRMDTLQHQKVAVTMFQSDRFY